MNSEDITSIIFEWQGTIQRKQGISRNLEKSFSAAIGSRPIKIVTGFRRSGKSFIVQRIAKYLIDNGKIEISNLLYLNLEDFRLTTINTPEKLNHIYETFLAVSANAGKKLLIFDEIQNVAGWDRFIRTIYERDEDIEIILTGSNSELLSNELGSNLAGRFIEFFLQPFSFSEYLKWHKMNVETLEEYQRNKIEIKNAFYNYLNFGGLPETFTITDNETKLSYLSGILSKVILDDVVKRFKVENISLLEKIFQYLIMNSGYITTFASIARHAKSLGINCKAETVINYCSYFIKAFALFDTNRFSWKQNRIFSDSHKFYSVDSGLITLHRRLAESLGIRLEQAVFSELLRRGNKPMFAANSKGVEIDFVTSDNERGYDKYQVTLTLTAENEKRELGAFAAADEWLQKGNNLLLSLDDDETPKIWRGITIERQNLIRWALNL